MIVSGWFRGYAEVKELPSPLQNSTLWTIVNDCVVYRANSVEGRGAEVQESQGRLVVV